MSADCDCAEEEPEPEPGSGSSEASLSLLGLGTGSSAGRGIKDGDEEADELPLLLVLLMLLAEESSDMLAECRACSFGEWAVVAVLAAEVDAAALRLAALAARVVIDDVVLAVLL